MTKIIQNKRGELIQLMLNADGKWEQAGSDGQVVFNGKTCLVWNTRLERYVMDTDPQADISQEFTSTTSLMDCERLKNGSW